jgi:hypothetical protein
VGLLNTIYLYYNCFWVKTSKHLFHVPKCSPDFTYTNFCRCLVQVDSSMDYAFNLQRIMVMKINLRVFGMIIFFLLNQN